MAYRLHYGIKITALHIAFATYNAVNLKFAKFLILQTSSTFASAPRYPPTFGGSLLGTYGADALKCELRS